jgi:hypothetical protein
VVCAHFRRSFFITMPVSAGQDAETVAKLEQLQGGAVEVVL